MINNIGQMTESVSPDDKKHRPDDRKCEPRWQKHIGQSLLTQGGLKTWGHPHKLKKSIFSKKTLIKKTQKSYGGKNSRSRGPETTPATQGHACPDRRLRARSTLEVQIASARFLGAASQAGRKMTPDRPDADWRDRFCCKLQSRCGTVNNT